MPVCGPGLKTLFASISCLLESLLPTTPARELYEDTCKKSNYPERLGVDALLMVSAMPSFLIQPCQNARRVNEAIWTLQTRPSTS